MLALLFTALVAAFGYFGTYTRKATVVGLLMPEQGVLRLTAHTAGVLSSIEVIEGQAVESGDTLFTISGERFSGAGGTEQLIAKQLNQRLLLLERNRLLADERLEGQSRMLDNRLRTIDEEHEGFTGELRLLQRRAALAEQQLQRQQELMRHAAYPYQRFGMTRGTVTQLVMTPYALQELPVHIASALTETSESADLYYRITVELDAQFINVYGAPQPLQTGMLLEADIVQDRRRLYEWALEPVYSVIGKRETFTE
ncbi:hypothetical protein [Billgrantia endophytica]|nr:hypothetical protein [Halomonas endophytica]